MAQKRCKIRVSTISAAGYLGVRKSTNTINWKVCTFDDPNWEKIVEEEMLRVREKLEPEMPSGMTLRVKVSKTETFSVDTFLDSRYPAESTNKKKIEMTVNQ